MIIFTDRAPYETMLRKPSVFFGDPTDFGEDPSLASWTRNERSVGQHSVQRSSPRLSSVELESLLTFGRRTERN